MQTNPPAGKMKLAAWWVIWLTLLAGLPQMYYLIGMTSSGRPVSPVSLATASLGLIPFFLSGILRWIVLPRLKEMQPALIAFIVGIALAEICCFLGLFAFRPYKVEFFVLSLIGIFQFIPLFARKFYDAAGN